MSDFRPFVSSSVTPTIQPQLAIPNATVPPTVHDQTNVPLTPDATPLTHERPQRRRAPAPRFDIDAPNQRSQLEFNQRALVSSSRLRILDQCQHSAFIGHDVPTYDTSPITATLSGDPITWKDILRMSDSDALRYRDATALELAGLKKKCISLIPKRAVPSGQRIYHASVNWTTKFTNGAYTKTKCWACFAGNTFDKTYRLLRSSLQIY